MKYTIILLTIFLLLPPPAQAQTKVLLKLSDCIDVALQKNPAMELGQAKILGADARSDEAGTALLPQLKFSGRLAQLSKIEPFSLPPPFPPLTLFPSIEQNYATRVSLQQPLFTGFRLKKNKEMADLNAEATRQEFARDQSDLVLGVKTAYWNLYRSISVERVIAQTVEQVTAHRNEVQNFAKQGLATDVDVMKVEVQLSDVKVRHIEAKSNVRLAAMSLNSLIGNPLDLDVAPADEPVPPGEARNDASPLLMDLQTLLARAQAQRPELKALHLRKEMGDAGVSAALGGWFPQIQLAANYDYARPNQRIIPPKDQWDGSWDVGVNLQWNVWDWFATKDQTSQAEASLRQTQAGLRQLSDAVALDVAQNLFRAREAQEKVVVARTGRDQSAETYRMTSEKFKQGVASNTELLDAEVALMQANLTYTQAIVDYTLSLARLKRATGEEL